MTPPGSLSAEGCDWDQPLDLAVRRPAGPGGVVSRRWEGSFLIVGRRTDCDLCLDDPTVSARHLYLQKLPGRVVAFDLGSRDYCQRTGILGRPGFFLTDRLSAGEEVQIGDFRLSFSAEKPRTDSTGLSGNPVPKLEQPVAVWELAEPGAPTSAARRTIQHEVTLIGRGPQCRLILAHESVSTTHASLVFIHGELQVIDLCSRYGVQVNGRLVKSSLLTDGDELVLGECRGVIRRLAPQDHPVEVVTAAAPTAMPEIRVGDEAPDEDGADSDFDGLTVRLGPDPPETWSAHSEPSPPATDLAVDVASDVAVDLQMLVSHGNEQRGQVREQARLLMESVRCRLEERPASSSRNAAAGPVAVEANPQRLAATPASLTDRPEVETDTELHVWLNHRLAGLDGEPQSRLQQFWKTLMGLF